MNLNDYMKLKFGVKKNGGIIFALNTAEAKILGIDPSKSGWAKRYKNVELHDETVALLKKAYSNRGIYIPRKADRIAVNLGDSPKNKFLYLMYNSSTKLHKIGISVDPVVRANSISHATGVLVELLNFWKVKSFADDVETSLHHQFKSCRKLGEWFDFSGVEDIPSLIESKMGCEFKRKK